MGQALTVLKFDLAFILRQFTGAVDGAEREAFLNRVTSMEESVGDVLKQMQNIAGSLRPTLLDDLGLNAAMRWFAEDYGTRTGPTWIWIWPGMRVLPNPAWAPPYFALCRRRLPMWRATPRPLAWPSV